MSARRIRGDGGLHWDERRRHWIASVTTGSTPDGKRIVRRGSGRTKTAAKEKLREIVRAVEDGHTVAEHGYTVEHAVRDWLTYGLTGRSPSTIETRRILAEQHVIPALGARKLRELSAEDVARWLAGTGAEHPHVAGHPVDQILLRSVTRAQARDKVRRNVVLLCSTPNDRGGRPSKALTYTRAQALLELDVAGTYGAYTVVGLLTGARTEELRALVWDDVDLIALPGRCVEVLREQRNRQVRHHSRAGAEWQEHGLVFASETGTALDAANVRRGIRTVLNSAGFDAEEWTPRGLRHSFVSLLSDGCMTIDQIARLVGHTGGSTVTELIYRKQIRPVIDDGATAMDGLFPRAEP